MIRVGITGQNGFVGTHLYNTLGLFPEEFERVHFEREFFHNQQLLAQFVKECDIIIHLAAINRDPDQNVLYETNLGLVSSLINALESTGSSARVYFASSSQEELDNPYGRSKKEGRQMFQKWAEDSNSAFTGLIIPNVFGPFGRPYFNSFIATFCHQLAHGEEPVVQADADVKLIYIGDLIQSILDEIRVNSGKNRLVIPNTDVQKVSSILGLLRHYKSIYQEKGIIPDLNSKFEVDLFNTFRSYIPLREYFPVKFRKNTDPRGTFVEIIKINSGGQVSFSTTVPGVTRGDHYHTRKIERFAVIQGDARIQLRRIGTEEVLNFNLSGEDPAYVDMPVWYTHNITNVGNSDLYTIFWINEFYDANDADTYFEKV